MPNCGPVMAALVMTRSMTMVICPSGGSLTTLMTACPALQPQNLSNPDYRWETNRKTEMGIELGAWKDRVLLGVSYYRNRSDNQLLGYPLPLVTGFPTIQYNLPAELQNTGWELELSFH